MGRDFIWSRSRRLAGIDIGRAAIKLVVLQHAMRRWRLDAYRIMPLMSADAEAVPQALLEARAGLASRQCSAATSLPATQALIHRLELPGVVSVSEMEAWVLQAARKQLPCALNEVLLDFYRVDDGSAVMLAAMKKDTVERRTDLVRRGGWTPKVVDLDALAMGRSTLASPGRHHLQRNNRIVIVDLGESSVRLHALRGDQILFSREQMISGLQGLSLPDLRERLVQEIRRALQLFHASSVPGVWRDVILAGGYAAVAGLDAHLSERAGVNVSQIDPFRSMLINPDLDMGELVELKTTLAQACGLAMSQVH